MGLDNQGVFELSLRTSYSRPEKDSSEAELM